MFRKMLVTCSVCVSLYWLLRLSDLNKWSPIFMPFFIIYKARVGRAFFLLSPSNASAPEWMDFCPDTSGSFSWSTRMLLMRADFLHGDSCLAESILPCGVLAFSKGSQILVVMTHLILQSGLLHRSVWITINMDLESRLLSGGCKWDQSVKHVLHNKWHISVFK